MCVRLCNLGFGVRAGRVVSIPTYWAANPGRGATALGSAYAVNIFLQIATEFIHLAQVGPDRLPKSLGHQIKPISAFARCQEVRR